MRILRFVAVFCLTGCASLSYDLDSVIGDQRSVELSETPFFPQEAYQCGPAALATILHSSGVVVTPTELTPAVFTPGRRGSLQQDLIGATRIAGRLPYQIDPDLEDLLAQLEGGRPVLVLQNLGVGWWSQWHYAVVIGYDRVKKRMILRSGTEARRETRVDAFLNTWARSDFWGIVALRPDDIPAEVDQARYFKAVAAIESIGEQQTALRFWTSAARRWPEHPVPLLGQGNVHLALAHYEDAVSSFETLLASGHFRSVATNNLAYATANLGRFDEALALLDAELVEPQDPDLLPILRETREEILAMQDARAVEDQS